MDQRGAGSAAIIDALEQRFLFPALYPAAPDLRQRALDIQARFDREVGPATRTVMFSAFVHELGYVARLFGGDASSLQRGVYRMVLPVVRPLMAKANGASDPDLVQRSFEITRLIAQWQDHPGVLWAQRMYREQRPPDPV